ncbi:hypothetical protein [Nocardia vaccinii]|uniref:hypothetical protein n=1 Tax=Nocardia vaccinii TaxID=1822 RepID=UPI000AE56E7A|nr:hypothetical protein [Nocardia vaccinii]
MVNQYPAGVPPVRYPTPGGPGWPGQPGAGWAQVPPGVVPAQGPRRSPIDLVAGIAAILTVAVQILLSCLEGNLIWFYIPRTHLFLGSGDYALLICQLATIVGAILLMTSGHRSPTARTVATLGIGGMFCFQSIAVLAAAQVYSIRLNWMLIPDFVAALVALVAIVIGNRSAGLAAPSAARRGRPFAPQGPAPQLVPHFGMPQPAMVQGAVPYQGAAHVPMQYPGMPQPGLPQQGIAPETIVQQPGPPGALAQPGMPPQAPPPASMAQQAMPQPGMSPGGGEPVASDRGYPHAGQQFSAPPATDIAAQGSTPQF